MMKVMVVVVASFPGRGGVFVPAPLFHGPPPAQTVEKGACHAPWPRFGPLSLQFVEQALGIDARACRTIRLDLGNPRRDFPA